MIAIQLMNFVCNVTKTKTCLEAGHQFRTCFLNSPHAKRKNVHFASWGNSGLLTLDQTLTKMLVLQKFHLHTTYIIALILQSDQHLSNLAEKMVQSARKQIMLQSATANRFQCNCCPLNLETLCKKYQIWWSDFFLHKEKRKRLGVGKEELQCNRVWCTLPLTLWKETVLIRKTFDLTKTCTD